MPTFTPTANATQKPWRSNDKFFVLEQEVDLSDAAYATVTNADVIAALSIPAHTLVTQVAIEIITVVAAGAVDLGHGGATDSWGTNISTATADVLCEPDSTFGAAGGFYYNTADTIDVLLDAAVTWTTLKFKLRAYCIDLSAL